MRPDNPSTQADVKEGWAYENENGIHLFKPFFLAFAVDDLHSWGSPIR
jgi:hypothetical protein